MMNSSESSDRRRELRIPIDAGPVGFLGSRASGHRSFSYLLQDISENGVGVFIPSGNISAKLTAGELINFHLPFQINQQFFDQGPVRWLQESEAGTFCGAHLVHRIPLHYPVFLSFQTGDIRFDWQAKGFPGPGALVERILEDAYFFKKGIQIYYGHLRPYFARQSRRKSRNEELASLDAEIASSIACLESTFKKAKDAGEDLTWLDEETLDQIRSCVLLELDIETLGEHFDSRVVWPYLRSIKLLEHQLYANFNTLVLLGRQSRSGTTVVT